MRKKKAKTLYIDVDEDHVELQYLKRKGDIYFLKDII